MPCYDPRDNEPKVRYVDRVVQSDGREIEALTKDLRSALKELNKNTAIACALINEIRKQPNATDIINNAATNGQVDVIGFYKEHLPEDEKRIMEFLAPLSQDEVALLKKMLNKERRNIKNGNA